MKTSRVTGGTIMTSWRTVAVPILPTKFAGRYLAHWDDGIRSSIVRRGSFARKPHFGLFPEHPSKDISTPYVELNRKRSKCCFLAIYSIRFTVIVRFPCSRIFIIVLQELIIYPGFNTSI